jgi:hypothetical protein
VGKNRTVRAGAIAAVAVVAGAAAVACGTVLEVSADDPTRGDASAFEEAAATREGSAAATDGGFIDASVGKLNFALQPGALDLFAGNPSPKSFKVLIERPPGDTTAVTVRIVTATAVVVAPLIAMVTPGQEPTFDVTAADVSPPQRATVSVQVVTTAGAVVLPLTALVTKHLRAAGGFPFTSVTDQTFDVKAWGAGGADPFGAGGGYARATIALPASTQLVVTVGASSTSTAGGMRGGGTGTQGSGAGGGYSGLFFGSVAFANARLVAGGGGGGNAGSAASTYGGAGGSTAGAAQSGLGTDPGFGGGGPAGGGNAGAGAVSGGPLKGGGGNPDEANGGGGGGGGYYGGGGGGIGSGGGGGSSFAPAGGSTLGGNHATPGNAGDPERLGAGDPTHAGAVLIVPK